MNSLQLREQAPHPPPQRTRSASPCCSATSRGKETKTSLKSTQTSHFINSISSLLLRLPLATLSPPMASDRPRSPRMNCCLSRVLRCPAPRVRLLSSASRWRALGFLWTSGLRGGPGRTLLRQGRQGFLPTSLPGANHQVCAKMRESPQHARSIYKLVLQAFCERMSVRRWIVTPNTP